MSSRQQNGPCIRNTGRAVIIRDGQVLLVRCRGGRSEYFVFPGGGQLPGELLSETVRRECEEEIGSDVVVEELLMVRERPNADSGHVVDFFFRCVLPDQKSAANGPEPDHAQEGVAWVPVGSLGSHRVHPLTLCKALVGVENLERTYAGVEG